MKSYVSLGICLIMLLASAVVVTADGPNYWGFSSSETHRSLVVGGTFTTSIWVNAHQSIDTVAVDNMTFTPGIIDYTSAATGNLFSSYIITIKPETSGNFDNTIGYAEPFVGASDTPVNTNGTLMTITWTMVTCGQVDFNITEGGTAYEGDDVPVTYIPFSIWVHPAAITGLTANAVNSTQINLAWTKHAGDDRTVIRGSKSGYPTTPTSGVSVYNNTGTSTSHTGLASGERWYYSAWGWNATTSLFTLTYVSAVEGTEGGQGGNGGTPQEAGETTTPPTTPPTTQPSEGISFLEPPLLYIIIGLIVCVLFLFVSKQKIWYRK